jgi:hypothetical protein
VKLNFLGVKVFLPQNTCSQWEVNRPGRII